ncbi:MAG TPA: hypothetical protein VG796_19295 [Verrucomicrobiales bacterium]|jgi:hypothetical protein|nr:hypothetical protein [Verrucomicrobiales bacterium]
MKHKRDAALTSLCAEVRPGDGIPPHILKRQQQKERHTHHPNRQPVDRHGLQYAKVAHRCLDGALTTLTSDASAGDCTVVSVEPASGGSVLLVVVSAPALTQDEIAAMEAHLRGNAGHLRAALAGETHRKRVPHLRFRVVPAESEGMV